MRLVEKIKPVLLKAPEVLVHGLDQWEIRASYNLALLKSE